MGTATRRPRDKTFLRSAAFAATGGVAAIGTSMFFTIASWRHGHPTTTFFFFSLWGLAALAGAAANIAVYFQSGSPPGKPPRGGNKVVALRVLETRAGPVTDRSEREAA